MRIPPVQLNSILKNIAPVYLISGDEPLQLGEAADAIRTAVKQQGYLIREVFSVDTGNEWSEIAAAAESLSLFAEKKLIDVRLPSGKLGNEGAKFLTAYCQRQSKDTVLLLSSPKLAASTLKSKWAQQLDQSGVIVQVWPLEGSALLQWLMRRAQQKGMNITEDAIKLLASLIEGNLLAAAQEIEKLYILFGEQAVSKQMLQESVADSARFDVFKLTDCVLAGRITRAKKILNGLKAEGIAAPVVLWALARETRMLHQIKTALKQGGNKETLFKTHRLWDKRKQLVNKALSHLNEKQLQKILLTCALADRQIKGQQQGDCWETMFSICLLFAVDAEIVTVVKRMATCLN